MMLILQVTWSLGLIRDDAADKVRLRAAQVGHQLIQIFLQEKRRVIKNTLAGILRHNTIKIFSVAHMLGS